MAQPGGVQEETSKTYPLTSSVSQSSEIHRSSQQFTEMHLADLQKVFEKEADENGGTVTPKAGFRDPCLGIREVWRTQTWYMLMPGVLFKTRVWLSGARISKAIWGLKLFLLRSC